MIRRKSLRRHRQKRQKWCSSLLGCFFFATLITVIGFTLVLILKERYSLAYRRPSLQLQALPSLKVDIWPDHTASIRKLETVLKNCQDDCNSGGADSNNKPIGLLRMPGTFGRAFEQFARQFVEETTNNMELEVTASVLPSSSRSNNMPLEDHFNKVIRLAVLPPLLEILDLAMEMTVQEFKISDFQDITRLWVRWHCQISFSKVERLTIPFDQWMAYPMNVEPDLAHFLQLPASKKQVVDMDEFAAKALERIDALNAYLVSLDNLTLIKTIQQQVEEEEHFDSQALQNAVDAILQQERDCDLLEEELSSSSSSRTTEMVGYLLDDRTDVLCSKYPQARCCGTDENNSNAAAAAAVA